MWTCPNCGRIFGKVKQPHSCRQVSPEQHFKNKDKAKDLFGYLFKQINSKIGKCKVISLPCCIHIFGRNDFLAVLPKKDRLEIRFGLNRKLDSPRLKQCVPVSAKVFKNCLDVTETEEINEELMKWVSEAYHLTDK